MIWFANATNAGTHLSGFQEQGNKTLNSWKYGTFILEYNDIGDLFIEDNIIVRFFLHPGIDKMKANWHHSKFKHTMYLNFDNLFEHDTNVV